jgi:hypothetical protein
MNAIKIIHDRTEDLIREYIINYFNELDDDKFEYYKTNNDDNDDDDYNNDELLFELFNNWENTDDNNFFDFVESNYNEECRFKFNKDFVYILQFVVSEYKDNYDVDVEPEKFTDLEYIINCYAYCLMRDGNANCILEEVFENYEREPTIILK